MPIGSAYETYMTVSDFNKFPQDMCALAMLKCIIVPDEKEQNVSSVLKEYDSRQGGIIEKECMKEIIREQCEEALEYLVKSWHGFRSAITTDRKKICFFLCPL